MVKKFTLVLFILLLTVSIIGAQADTPTVFCGDLSEADCTLLGKSQQVMAEVTSFAFDLNANLELGGLDVVAGQDTTTFGLNGNGVLVADFGDLMGMTEMSPADMTAMFEMLPKLMDTIFTGLQTDTTLEVVIPAELMTPGMPELTFHIIMVDGIIYLDAAPLMGMPQPMWMGIDLAGFMSTMMDEATGQMDLGALSGMFEGLDMSAMQDMYDPSTFTTITRLDDQEVMGQAVAVFQTTVDYSAIFGSETFREAYGAMFNSMMEAQGLNPADMGMDVEQLLDMMETMFADTTFNITEWIGTEDFYMHYGAVDFGMTLDMAAIAGMEGGAMTPGMPETVTMSLQAEVNLSDFNAEFDIVAPEGAQIIDPMDFLGSGF